jgi:hypothetical protein
MLNLPPIGEETFLICMALAVIAGALVGFALGYGLKEKRHSGEIESIIRIARRIEAAKKERAPKGPLLTSKLWKEKGEEDRKRPSPWPC